MPAIFYIKCLISVNHPQQLNSILSRIANFIEKHQLCHAGQKILIATSGGPDSICLAFAMKELGYQIGLAHINYQFRGKESDSEEMLVRAFAEKLGVPVYVKSLDTSPLVSESKDSLQQVARRIRYDFFEKIMKKHAYDRCALAHQADDQSEQVLLSLLTGNATSIIQQIPIQRENFIRPLLAISRDEIMDFLHREELAYAIDSSNLKNDYLRNRIRNRVRPELKEINPKADQQLRKKQQWYAQQKAFLDKSLTHWLKSCLLTEEEEVSQILDWRPFIDTWGKEHLPLLLAQVLSHWDIHGHALWQGIELKDAQVGKRLIFGDKELIRVRNGLEWSKKDLKEKEQIVLQEADFLASKCVIDWGTEQIRISYLDVGKPDLANKKHFYLAAEYIQFPLTVRSWQQGDSMQPFGMKGHKKLSDIFVDEKYTNVQKSQAFVLEDQDKILLLSGFRIADSVKVSSETNRILFVEII